MKILIRIGYILIALLFLAILTNPSYSRFEEFCKENDAYETKQFVLRKKSDYLIFSVYEKERYFIQISTDEWQEKEIYYGYFLNFHLKHKIRK